MGRRAWPEEAWLRARAVGSSGSAWVRFTSVWILCAAWGAATEGPWVREKLEALDRAVESAVMLGQCPGAVVWVEYAGAVHERAFGWRSLEPDREAMTFDTIFDLASLTKVVATTPAVMQLVEAGLLELDRPVAWYWPEFGRSGKQGITVRQLLTHTSGLRPGLKLGPGTGGREAVLLQLCEEVPMEPPGAVFRYSDLNFIVLGELVERVSALPFEVFCRRRLFAPLGMRDTGFQPGPEERQRVAPTERLEDGTILRGTVHDPTARRMGGVAGHAGLFSTGSDLARFARMLLQGGELDGVRVLRPDTVRLMTSVQVWAGPGVRRALGWDMESPYSSARGRWFSPESYGHTGWTGTSLWVDPTLRMFVILLANRNHPVARGDLRTLRYQVATLAAEAVGAGAVDRSEVERVPGR